MIGSKLLIIDTETGGLSAAKYSILSLGAVIWQDRSIIDEIEIFVKEPAVLTDPEALRVTGFDLSVLSKRGKTPEHAVSEFGAFLSRSFGDPKDREKIPVAGHNVGFDLAFCERLYRLGGSSIAGMFSHRVLDTASILAFLVLAGKLPTVCQSSDGAFEYFEIKFAAKERHTALADARATATLLSSLLQMLEDR